MRVRNARKPDSKSKHRHLSRCAGGGPSPTDDKLKWCAVRAIASDTSQELMARTLCTNRWTFGITGPASEWRHASFARGPIRSHSSSVRSDGYRFVFFSILAIGRDSLGPHPKLESRRKPPRNPFSNGYLVTDTSLWIMSAMIPSRARGAGRLGWCRLRRREHDKGS